MFLLQNKIVLNLGTLNDRADYFKKLLTIKYPYRFIDSVT